jgi:hypothetical protein
MAEVTATSSVRPSSRFVMPTVLRIGPFRFHFYSDESDEPAHIHVRSGDGECKFWLQPVGLATNRGIPNHDLRNIERLVFEHQQLLVQKYHERHNR